MKTVSILGYALMVTGLLGLIATNSLFSPLLVVIGDQVVAVALMRTFCPG